MSQKTLLQSLNPATQEVIWEGPVSTLPDVQNAIAMAQQTFPRWSQTPLPTRKQILLNYAAELTQQKPALSTSLSQETGKPLWEAQTEVQAAIQKVAISIEAYDKRCAESVTEAGGFRNATRYKPHGVLGVFGPFNLPLHLPNGHIVPALLAGNTAILKPSEQTPRIAELMMNCWTKAGLPAGVLQVLQGDQHTGRWLAEQPALSGILFTGSARVGLLLSRLYAEDTGKMLALEMGGNNPLIIHDVNDFKAARHHLLLSAFITSGQRCTCARRLIVLDTPEHRKLVQDFVEDAAQLAIGPYTQTPEPFMGPVISAQAAEQVRRAYQRLVDQGAKVLLPLKKLNPEENASAWVSPMIVDTTSMHSRPDEEYFGPLLQVIWVKNLEEALREANNTAFGLAAGIFTTDENVYQQFYRDIRAGIVNWNRPLTGASSNAPFGGVGKSGNHRPSAYFAADYCAYPVASQEEPKLQMPGTLLPGISLL